MMHELLEWLSEVSGTRGRRFNHVFLLHFFEGLFLPLVRIERYNGLEKETREYEYLRANLIVLMIDARGICLRRNTVLGRFRCESA